MSLPRKYELTPEFYRKQSNHEQTFYAKDGLRGAVPFRIVRTATLDELKHALAKALGWDESAVENMFIVYAGKKLDRYAIPIIDYGIQFESSFLAVVFFHIEYILDDKVLKKMRTVSAVIWEVCKQRLNEELKQMETNIDLEEYRFFCKGTEITDEVGLTEMCKDFKDVKVFMVKNNEALFKSRLHKSQKFKNVTVITYTTREI
jgi:hypothetical protein